VGLARKLDDLKTAAAVLEVTVATTLGNVGLGREEGTELEGLRKAGRVSLAEKESGCCRCSTCFRELLRTGCAQQ
jgi:hypothetical protein